MKKLLFVLGIIVGLSGCHRGATAPAPPPINKDWAITVSLNYDFTNFVPCSSTVTKGCISGFTWGYLQGSTQVPVKTSPASICSGTVQPETCTDTGNSTLGIGQVVFYAVANGIDNSGASVISGQGTSAPITVNAVPPTNVTISIK